MVGTNADADWPMAQFVDVNNAQRITFNLTAVQAAAAQTLRIGITLGFEGGRNRVTVNAGQPYAWTSGIPAASRDLNSRGITRGTYRGDNQVYTYNIPTSALRAGVNTIDLPVVSGSSGSGFLSPNVVYDAIDLVPTASLTNAPRVNSIAITPVNAAVGPGGLAAFTATSRDQFGNVIPANIDWSTARGVIDDAGLYTAPVTAGGDTITAAVGAVSASTTVNVLGGVPIVVTPAGAAANPVFNNMTALGVLGGDEGGEANLTYTWSVVGTPPAPVTFSANGTNAAKNAAATFSKPGDYRLLVTIAAGGGATATSSIGVSVRDSVAWYKADAIGGATLVDDSGSDDGAKLFGVYGSYGLAAGVHGSALKLNGGTAGGYASLPAGIVSGLNDFTISAWVKPDAANTWARIFDFGNGPTTYMFLTARSGTAGNGLRFAITTNGIAGEQVVNGPALATGVWTHVAITLAGNTATLYVNGQAYAFNASLTTHPASLGVTTNNFVGKSQFADPMFQGSIDDFRIYGRALSPADVSTLADTTAPTVVDGTFAFDSPSQSIGLTFSEDVIASLDSADLSVVDLVTGRRVPASQFVLATQGGPGVATTATWSRDPSAGPLPDGNYRVTLPAGSVTDAAGNSLAADYTFDFFVLAGDANRDRVVNFSDLLIVARNYNGTGKTYGDGDLNSDGAVSFADLLILARSYGKALAVPPTPAPMATTQAVSAAVLGSEAARPVFATTRLAPVRAVAPARAVRVRRR